MMRIRSLAAALAAACLGLLAVTGSAQAAKGKGIGYYYLCTDEHGCYEYASDVIKAEFATGRWGFAGEGPPSNPFHEVSKVEYLFEAEGCEYPAVVSTTGFNSEEDPERYTCENGESEEFWFREIGFENGGEELKLTPTTTKTATATVPYHSVFTVSKGTGPYHFSESGQTPAGLSWNTAAEGSGSIELVGTPTTAGTSHFTIEAEDSSAPTLTVRREYTLTVQLALSSLGKGTAGQPYDRQLTSGGGTPPYTFSVTGGSLPAGLELSETGEVHGTPTQAGSSTFSITASDSSVPAVTRTVQYTVPVQLGVTPGKLPTGEVGTPFGEAGEGVQLVALGGTPPYQYEVIGIPGFEPPAGLTAEDGLISGTPEVAGDYAFILRVTDSSVPALIGVHRYSFKVKPPSVGLPPGSWVLEYFYSDERVNPQRDGIVVERKGKIHDEDGAPGVWSYNAGHVRFTLEISLGDVIVYEGSGPGPNGPFEGTWDGSEKPFTLRHEA